MRNIFTKIVIAVIGITLIVALMAPKVSCDDKQVATKETTLNEASTVGAPSRFLASNKSSKKVVKKSKKSKKPKSKKSRRTVGKKSKSGKKKRTVVRRSRVVRGSKHGKKSTKGKKSKRVSRSKKGTKKGTRKGTKKGTKKSKKVIKVKNPSSTSLSSKIIKGMSVPTTKKVRKSKKGSSTISKKGKKSKKSRKSKRASKKKSTKKRTGGKKTKKIKKLIEVPVEVEKVDTTSTTYVRKGDSSYEMQSVPFDKMSSWLTARKRVEPVRVEAKTTVVRTVQSKPKGGKTRKQITREILSEPITDEVDITSGTVKKIYVTRGAEKQEVEAEPYKTYILMQESSETDDGSPMTVETKAEVHHRFVEQPESAETSYLSFYEEDESVRSVDGLTEIKEAKLIAMLIETAAENASSIVRSALESIRIVKFGNSGRKDCPNVTTTSSSCAALCGAGEKYKFKLWWDPSTETCKKETFIQDCVVVSGCDSPAAKWNVLQVHKPNYLPKNAFLSLANLIPSESSWQKDITSDGFVFYSFTTPLSERYCPFSGRVMDDDECGIAYKYYFTQFLDTSGGSVVARGGFDRVPDILTCETSDNRQQLSEEQERDVLIHLLQEYVDERDESGSILEALRELRIESYEANNSHPMCPSITTNQSSCTSQGCGHGRKYSLTSSYSPVTEVCQTLRQEPCMIISGCEDGMTKWSLLEVEKPDRVPTSVFLALASLIPSESEWQKVKTKRSNVLRVGFTFSTPWTQRFSVDGEPLSDDQCGSAQRWRYTREYSQQDDAILQDFIAVDASIPCNDKVSTNKYYTTKKIIQKPSTKTIRTYRYVTSEASVPTSTVSIPSTRTIIRKEAPVTKTYVVDGTTSIPSTRKIIRTTSRKPITYDTSSTKKYTYVTKSSSPTMDSVPVTTKIIRTSSKPQTQTSTRIVTGTPITKTYTKTYINGVLQPEGTVIPGLFNEVSDSEVVVDESVVPLDNIVDEAITTTQYDDAFEDESIDN